jgi:hypothetical protein
MSFVYGHFWTCTVDVLSRAVAQQVSSFDEMQILTAELGRFHFLI